MDYISILVAALPIILYAIAELWKAAQSGEPFDAVLFIKTIVIALVSAGLITQQTADIVLALAATSVIGFALDKLFNALIAWIRKRQKP